MTSRDKRLWVIGAACIIVTLMVSRLWASAEPDKSSPAATIANPVHEDQLNNVALSTGAVRKLGIQTAVASAKILPAVRLYGGEITVPTGQTVIVSAPLSGLLQEPPKGMPKPGEKVVKDQVIFMLSPILSAEARTTLATSRVDADGQLRNAETQEQATKIAVDRAKRLLRDQVGSQRSVDEAQATYDVAVKSLQAARQRKNLLDKAVGAGTVEPVPVKAPQSGILRNINTLPGQNVNSNTPLFELANTAKIWIKVSVPVGDLSNIQRHQPVQIGSLSARSHNHITTAYPVAAPPSANPLLGTVDVFYAMGDETDEWTPGQRVGVTIPLEMTEEHIVIPWSSIVFDIYGSSWVYEQSVPQNYKRHRVDLGYVSGNDVAIIHGINAGMTIVTRGAQEIFGAETGFSK